MGEKRIIRIAGRRSKLAVIQSEQIKALIESKFPDVECPVLAVHTLGDHVQSNHSIRLVVRRCGQKS